jgi:uncharacterized membrane protein
MEVLFTIGKWLLIALGAVWLIHIISRIQMRAWMIEFRKFFDEGKKQ